MHMSIFAKGPIDVIPGWKHTYARYHREYPDSGPLPPTGFLHKDTHPTCRYSLCTAFHKHEGLTQVFMLCPQKQILLPTVTWSKCLSVRCGKFPEGMINTLRYWAFIGGRKEVTGKRFGKLTKGENRMRETEFSGKLTLYPELPQGEGTARMRHFHC